MGLLSSEDYGHKLLYIPTSMDGSPLGNPNRGGKKSGCECLGRVGRERGENVPGAETLWRNSKREESSTYVQL